MSCVSPGQMYAANSLPSAPPVREEDPVYVKDLGPMSDGGFDFTYYDDVEIQPWPRWVKAGIIALAMLLLGAVFGIPYLD